jgi:hypothetical protein
MTGLVRRRGKYLQKSDCTVFEVKVCHKKRNMMM